MKVLFIGNSYTYYNDMPGIFERLAQDNGKNMRVYSVTQGGRKLGAYHDSEDKVTKKLDGLLSEHRFDLCFIQENSIVPILDYDGFISGLECLMKKTKDRVDKVVLYATWGRKTGSETLTEHGWTNESMTEELAEAYTRAAKQFGVSVSHVGLNFFNVYTNHSDIELYNEDLTHPSYKGSCLAALTHYYTCFNEFPQKTAVLSLSDAELVAFKKAVCKKV